MSIDYENPFIKDNIFKGEFGLEMESLRVDKDGYLSHTKHPFDGNCNIERDFCENQVEIITNVNYTVEDLYAEIGKLRSTVMAELRNLESGQEFLWPFSNPPYVKGDSDIPIAKFEGELKEKEFYRHYLAEKYGKRKMLFSGIHLNFSFPQELLEETYKQSNFSCYQEYKNQIYLELAKKLTKYSWLIVYLTASSPVMDSSFFDENELGKDVEPQYSSPRCSKIGYWNDFIPLLEYNSLKEYIKSIQNYSDEGKLKSVSELYYPVRLKPLGENSLENLELNGINHIELRMLDLNPLSPVGIMKEDIDFVHLFIIYLMSFENIDFHKQEQIISIKNIKLSAEYNDEKILIQTSQNEILPVKEAASEILNNMEEFFSKYSEPNISEILQYQRNKVLYKHKRYAQIIKEQFGHNYVTKGIRLSKKYAEEI